MSEQAQFLVNVIDSIKRNLPNKKGCVSLLRTICKLAAEQAPEADLVRMGEFLLDLRLEAARQHVEKGIQS